MKTFVRTIIIIMMMLFTVNTIMSYSETLYDDTSLDLISTNFYNGSYRPFIFSGSSYDSIHSGECGYNNCMQVLARNNYNDKQILGTSFNYTYEQGRETAGSGVCIGDGILGTYLNIGNMPSFYNGYCIVNINWLIRVDNGVETYLTTLISPFPSSYNMKFYIDNGYIILMINDTIITNYSDTGYIPDNDTTYMFFNRIFIDTFWNYLNISSIYDIETTIPTNNITICGNYTLENNYYEVNISSESMSNPCLELNINNATLRCSDNIIGNGIEDFINIKSMNDGIIEDCNFENFNAVFEIPEYYLEDNSYNNIFRNISGSYLQYFLGFNMPVYIMNHTLFSDITLNHIYQTSFGVLNSDDMIFSNIIINDSYTGYAMNHVSNLLINDNNINSGTIFGIYLYDLSNPQIINNIINNIYICGIGLSGVNNAYFYNNINDMYNFEMTIPKFCIGEFESTINPLSSHNLGWFPKDEHDTLIGNLDELSYYNITQSYDIILNDTIYQFVRNNTKYYFITPECPQDWEKDINACIDGVSLITYHDNNDCMAYGILPSDNDTNEYCSIAQHNEYSDDMLIVGILFLFLIISLISGIFIHEGFFGMCALLVALMMTSFIIYDYPMILIFASIFLILLFCVMWIIISSKRR